MIAQKFYKEGDRWFIDCPECAALGVSKEQLKMHITAGEWLNWIVNDDPKVTKLRLEFSTTHFPGSRPLYKSDRGESTEWVYFFPATDLINDHWGIILSDYFKFNGEFKNVIYFKIAS